MRRDFGEVLVGHQMEKIGVLQNQNFFDGAEGHVFLSSAGGFEGLEDIRQGRAGRFQAVDQIVGLFRLNPCDGVQGEALKPVCRPSCL